MTIAINHWQTDRCAKAFWDQKLGGPYQQLQSDTVGWAAPKPGERWLDLGCGSGALTRALCEATGWRIGSVRSLDCAAANESPLGRINTRLQERSPNSKIQFEVADFSKGLPSLPNDSFDGCVSGLAISYAESFDPESGNYTDQAFRHLFREVNRVLKPGSRFVFSVNVPDPNFWKIVWHSIGTDLRLSKPFRILTNAIRMQMYGRWLRQEASRGRFHYLPIEELRDVIEASGLRFDDYRLSYADQAYVIRTTST